MIKVRTFIGPKVNFINGINRQRIEIERYLKNRKNIKLIYEYYVKTKHELSQKLKYYLDYLLKRYLLYTYNCKKVTLEKNTVNHIIEQSLAFLALFLNKKQTLITCHDAIIKDYTNESYILKKYSKLGLKRCRYIIAISDFTKNDLIKKFKITEDKIIVIKNAVNREMFKPIFKNELDRIKPLYPESKKILYVGSEEYRKNFLTILKAFYIIRKEIDDIKLISLGVPSFFHIKIVKTLNLEKDIIYLGNISNERLREVYNLCDFFVSPSLYEGFGFPGLEAAACGTPVICSDIPVFREIYKDFPIYFPPKDFKTLAKIILDNIENESLKQELSKKGLRVSKTYSWKRSSEKYFKLINYIINNQH